MVKLGSEIRSKAQRFNAETNFYENSLAEVGHRWRDSTLVVPKSSVSTKILFGKLQVIALESSLKSDSLY